MKNILVNIPLLIQVILLILWCCDIINRTFLGFVLVTSITWFPYLCLFVLKGFEKILRRKIENKINKNKTFNKN